MSAMAVCILQCSVNKFSYLRATVVLFSLRVRYTGVRYRGLSLLYLTRGRKLAFLVPRVQNTKRVDFQHEDVRVANRVLK